MIGLHELGDMWVKVGSILIFIGVLLMILSGKVDDENEGNGALPNSGIRSSGSGADNEGR